MGVWKVTDFNPSSFLTLQTAESIAFERQNADMVTLLRLAVMPVSGDGRGCVQHRRLMHGCLLLRQDGANGELEKWIRLGLSHMCDDPQHS